MMQLMQDLHKEDKEAEATREKAQDDARKQELKEAREHELRIFRLLMGKGDSE